MSKIKLLFDVVSDLHSLADSIQAVADAMSDTQEAPKPAEKAKLEKKKPTVSLEQVRTVLAKKSNEGLTAEVRELLKKHGADKLSGIDPEKYEALLQDAEVLGNGG